MLNFFEALFSYIEVIWGFFLNFINSLLGLFTTLLSAVILPEQVAHYMWGPIGTSCLALTGFAIVKMIVGRSNV